MNSSTKRKLDKIDTNINFEKNLEIKKNKKEQSNYNFDNFDNYSNYGNFVQIEYTQNIINRFQNDLELEQIYSKLSKNKSF
jgi:hypothetical protein